MSDFVPLPPGVYRDNAGQQCDMLIGPCACGATHEEVTPTQPDKDAKLSPGLPATAGIQWLNDDNTIGIIRVFNAGGQFGDPYVWCATVHVIRSGVVEMLGVMSAPTLSQVRAIRKTLNAEGITLLIFERRYGGEGGARSKLHVMK